MLGAAALTLAGCWQQEMGTWQQQLLRALRFLHPRHGRTLSALVSPADPSEVVTLVCCLSSRGNDAGRPLHPSVLSREAQLTKERVFLQTQPVPEGKPVAKRFFCLDMGSCMAIFGE